MPLSADRCQVTWGPNRLKRAEVGRGGSWVYAYVCVHIQWLRMCMSVHEGVFVCLALFTLDTHVHLG